MRIPLQTGWQGGPAWISLEVDEHELDEGVGAAVLIEFETPLDIDSEGEFGIGTGTITLPPGKGALRFVLCASLNQARTIRDELTRLLEDT